jgi:hypothetical protein
MNDFQHKNIANGRWSELTLSEQLGNIGSEVGRAVKWQSRQKFDMRDSALDRAFELLYLTIADQRWRGVKRKEICRAREVLADTFLGDRIYGSTPESMEKYFYHYAVMARNKI